MPSEKLTLPHISQTKPLDATDLDCLAEVKAVLARYGKLEKFGVSLLHQHFNVGPDETLIEESDPVARTLMHRVVPTESLGDATVRDTQWHLASAVPTALAKCRDLWHVER
jgi:hypothetical protein